MSEENTTTETETKKQPAKRIITIMDNYRMRLETPNPKGGERPSSLGLTFVGDNPRFNLNTNVPSDPREGYLPVRINIRTLQRLMHLIIATAKGDSPNGNTIKNHHNYDGEGNYHETPVHVSTFVVGKEEDGRIYVALTAQGYTPTKFHFVADPYHVICNRKGEPLPVAEVSPMLALDYAELVISFLPMALHEVAMAKGVALDAPVKAQEGDDPSVEEQSRDRSQPQRNNGGGGGYNKGGYNNNRGGNYNNNRGGGYNKGGGNNYRGGNNNYQNNRGGNNNYQNNRNNYNNGGGGGGSYKKEQSADFDTTSDVSSGDLDF